jgi:Lon protease-like protein
VNSEPATVAMFPLSTVLFPHAELPLHVFEPRYRALVEDVLAADRRFGTVLISAGSEVGGGERRCGMGTMLQIEMVVQTEDGRSLLVTKGIERIRVLKWLEDDPYPRAIVEPLPSVGEAPEELLVKAAACVRRVRMLLSELDEGPCSPIAVDLVGDESIDSWMVCALAPLGLFDAERLLEIPETTARLETLVEMCCARICDLETMLSQPNG